MSLIPLAFTEIINAVIPRIPSILKIFEPTTFPTAISDSFLYEARTTVISSGRLVPMATTVSPIIASLTPIDLATAIASAINNDSAIKAGGSSVSVQYDSTTQAFTINTDKYGTASTLSLDSGTLLTSGVTGLAVTAQVTGQDVQGSLDQNGTFFP